jgi:hypothetical protein
VTAGVTKAAAACTTAGVGDDATTASGVMVMVIAGADPVTVESRNTDDPVAGSGDTASRTVCTAVIAATRSWCTTAVTAAPSDGVGSGDGGLIVDTEESGAGVEPGDVEPGDGEVPMLTLKDAGVESAGVESAGVESAGVESAGVEDAGLPVTGTVGDIADVAEGVPVVVVVVPPLEDSVLVGGVWRRLGQPAPAEESDPLLDVVPGDKVPAVELLDEVSGLLPDEEVPVLLLDADEEPPVVVVSAWAIPNPLASAAPMPRVTAPAVSQL